MSISIEEVERIAKLSRLSLGDDEKQKFSKELSSILNYLDQLKEVQDKVDVKPFEDPDSVNFMRDDVAESLTPPSELIKLAPASEDGFYKVKSVLE